MQSSLEMSSQDSSLEVDLLDQERKRLEEEGRKAAARVNQVSESLEEKYLKLKLKYSNSFSKIAAEIKDLIEDSLNEFKTRWKILEKENKDILECICIPKHLSSLSRKELKDLKRESDHLEKERLDILEKFQLELENIDKKRAQKVDEELKAYNKEVRLLKFLPNEVITRMIQVWTYAKRNAQT